MIMCCSLGGIRTCRLGIIVGTTNMVALIWILTGSIVGHKWALGCSMSFGFIDAGLSTVATCIYVLAFTLSAPIGVVIGMIVANSENALGVAGVFNALCLGTLLWYGGGMVTGALSVGSNLARLAQFILVLCGAAMVYGMFFLHLEVMLMI